MERLQLEVLDLVFEKIYNHFKQHQLHCAPPQVGFTQHLQKKSIKAGSECDHFFKKKTSVE